MKHSRTYFFIAISSLALIVILVIQVNWILQTAQIKEELFNEKANMVLSRATEALGSNVEACRKIEAVVIQDSSAGPVTNLGNNEVHTIDSLFTHYMRFYNFHVDYTFEVVKPQFAADYGSGFANNTYNKPLDEVATKSGIALKLILPEKKQFIIAEMGPLFITSVILVFVVLILFWRTILSLMKEKQLSEHTNEFLNNMTHEFKTPLTNIALAGKMIMKNPALMGEEKIKYYSGIILGENEKLSFQVEQVLSMTALERGEIPVQKTALDFHLLIKDALKHISIQIENRQGDMKLSLDAEHFMVMGDRTHLINALCNLVDNAVKYSSGKPELSIHTSTIGHMLLVTVGDKGIGIEKEYQKKVFDTFFRVPTGDVHDVKGFGLGLAYTKKIVELHGGTLELASEKGKGTTFIIKLPYA